MSHRHNAPELLIEWDPNFVRVSGPATGQVAEGATLADISSVNGRAAIVMLSRGVVLHRVVDLPDASKSDVLLALRARLADLFPVDASTLAYDILATAERGEFGRRFHVFAARATDIARVLQECDQAGVTPAKLVPAAIMTVPAAGQPEQQNGIFAERFGDQISLDFVKNGIVCASKMSKPGQLELDVSRMRLLSGDESAAATTPVFVYGCEIDGPSIPLGGTHASRFNIGQTIDLDLEPESYRVEKLEKARGRSHRLGYLLFAAGSLVAGLSATNYVDSAAAQSAYERKVQSRLKASSDRLGRVTSDISKLKKPADQLVRGFEPAQKLSDLLKISSSLVPPGVWLSGVTLERGKQIQIRATSKTAEQANAYLASITKQSRFRDVKLVFLSSSEIDKVPVIQFTISAFPIGNFPITENSKVKK